MTAEPAVAGSLTLLGYLDQGAGRLWAPCPSAGHWHTVATSRYARTLVPGALVVVDNLGHVHQVRVCPVPFRREWTAYTGGRWLLTAAFARDSTTAS